MPRRIVATAALLTFALASCRTWTPLEGIPDPMPNDVRVALASGDTIRVRDPIVEEEFLVGTRDRGQRTSYRIPLAEIASIESHEPDLRRTWIAIGLGVGLLAAIAWQIAHNFEVDFSSSRSP